MLSAIWQRYKINFLLALLLAVLVIFSRQNVLGVLFLLPMTLITHQPLTYTLNLVGLTLVGTVASVFFLDLDFLYYSFFTKPDSPLSLSLRNLLAQKNYAGLLTYLNHHEDELVQPILRSALFQVVLLILCSYLAFSEASLLGTVFALGIFLQSLSLGWQRRDKDWFWLLRDRPSPQIVTVYFIIVALAFLYLLSLLR